MKATLKDVLLLKDRRVVDGRRVDAADGCTPDVANLTHDGLVDRVPRLRVAEVRTAVEAGTAGANSGPIFNEVASFSGVEQSGMDGKRSKYGIEGHFKIKYVCMAGT